MPPAIHWKEGFPGMYFKRLEIHGFKSFVEPCVIEFTDGITCIVGPNGSGKSNISDALRWVLGEQSPALLRGSRMDEVIFNGTETMRPRGMAEVTLVIDNTDGYLDIDYSEVAVSRRAYRNGENEYLINGNPCRLRDIRGLFRDTGIGVEGYSIIGQGKIQDIISGKSDGRREILEEVSGISSYKARKLEAVRKLERTAQNLERIEDITGELEERLITLEKESEKASRYLAIKDRYRELEVNIILRNIESAEKRIEESRAEREELNSLAEEAGRLKEQNREESLSLREYQSELEKKISVISAEMPRTAVRLSSLENEIRTGKEREERVSRYLSSACEEISRLEEEKRSRATERKTLADDLDNKIRIRELRKRELSEAESKFRDIRKKGAAAGEIAEEWNNRLFSLHSEAAAKKSEAKSIESYRLSLERRINTVASRIEELETARKERKKELALALEDEKVRKKREKELGTALEEIKETGYRLETELEEKVGMRDGKIISVERMRSRLRTIEEMEQNFEGYAYAVRFIMGAGLPGIEGVAVNMISVPEGLETAVETALGPSRQNIVCSGDEDAKRAVRSLKDNRAGRLTFLPVETVRGTAAHISPDITGDPGFIGVASELISCDDRYRDIFRFLLGRVILTRDLTDAVRLSKNGRRGLRFVSLEGDVVNTAGAITGGRYKERETGILGRKNEKIRLERDIRTQDNETAELEEKINELRKKHEENEKRSVNTSGEIRELELLLNASAPAREAMEKQTERDASELERLERELDQAEEELKKTSDMSHILAEESGKAEQEIEELSRKIESAVAAGEEQRREEAEAAGLLEKCRLEEAKAASLADGAGAVLERADRESGELENRLSDALKRKEEFEKELAELALIPERSGREVRELRNEKAALEEESADLQKERDIVVSRIRESDGRAEKAEREISAYRDQAFRIELSASKSETQSEHLKERLWNDFGMSFAEARELRTDDFVMNASVKESRELKEELRDIGEVNTGSIGEYREVSRRYNFLSSQRDDVIKAKEELEAVIRETDRKIIRGFQENFGKVQKEFGKIFRELFGGGHAEIKLDDERDPLGSGISLVAQPPGKKLQNINLLSGGEKTLTAIALMLAVIRVKPTPFCILDEVEAALDEANIERFIDCLRDYKNTQFAVITHQKATMAHGDTLFGVTMEEAGVSKVLSIRLSDPGIEKFTEERVSGQG